MLPTVNWSTQSRRTAVNEARPTNGDKSFTRSLAFPSVLIRSSTARIPKLHRAGKSFSQHRLRNKMAAAGEVDDGSNVLRWMQEICPSDILPKILSYSGPQCMTVLSKTNKFFRDTMQQEGTWMVLCTELGKWNEGDSIPKSWRVHYETNIIVPVDYASIEAALAVASPPNQENHHSRIVEQSRSIRILLQPIVYYLREAITIQAVGTTEITIETHSMPVRPVTSLAQRPENEITDTSATVRALKKAASIRNMLSCRSVAGIDTIGLHQTEENNIPDLPPPIRASLELRTRRHNEPLFRVRQGTVKLVNIQLVHNSNGIDIWNGNAAIQIQPFIGPDNEAPIAMILPRPSAYMERVDVSSMSGRGIVNIDGGFVSIKECYVHDCAATGIYVGGPGSEAIIETSDVVLNGNGNRLRRGIARGHSGIYLEQGNALVRDCNISRNSLTGISAISVENAILHVRESDLVANGTTQLEMPPSGSIAHRLSTNVNNLILPVGTIRPRSGIVHENQEVATFLN